ARRGGDPAAVDRSRGAGGDGDAWEASRRPALCRARDARPVSQPVPERDLMLRTIFVALLALFLGSYALKGAFEALLFYLWIAYFRPESWVWNGDWLRILNLSFVSGLYLFMRSLRSDAKFRFDLQSALLVVFFFLSLGSTLQSKYLTYAWPFWV